MEDKKWRPSENELIEIFKQQGIDSKYQNKFLDYYNSCFDDLFEYEKDCDNDYWKEGDSIHETSLSFTKEDLTKYIELINKGHSEKWSDSLACTIEEGEAAIFHTHSDLQKVDKNLAQKDLVIYTKSLGGDALFEKYYLYLFAELDDVDGRIEKARKYSKIYKEEIAKGKTEIYADKYADFLAEGEFCKTYCEQYAFAFDKAVSENRTDYYTKVYAKKYAECLTDILGDRNAVNDNKMLSFATEQVSAYMYAWEYAKENKIENFDVFASIYETVHLNTYFAGTYKNDFNKSEFNQQVLKETLENFTK